MMMSQSRQPTLESDPIVHCIGGGGGSPGHISQLAGHSRSMNVAAIISLRNNSLYNYAVQPDSELRSLNK